MPTALRSADLDKLEALSWIDRLTAERNGLRRVDRYEGAELTGRTPREDCSGIAFPAFFPGYANVREWFLRLDRPLSGARYFAPPGRGNILVFATDESPESLTDTRVMIVLVEGLKKLLAAYRLARYNSEFVRFIACGITGCWNWRGVIGKAIDATGARIDLKSTLPDFDRIIWPQRDVVVVFDSDCLTNPLVNAARRGLVAELRRRGAYVRAIDLPPLEGLYKVGFDDFLARKGPELALALLRQQPRPHQERQREPVA